MILEGTSKLKLEPTWEPAWELTWELAWELTWELAWEFAVGASAVDAFAADEPFAAGSAELLKLWGGEICAVGSEEPSPLCGVPIAVAAFAGATFDVGHLEDVAATCVGAASAEVAFAGGAFAEETFAVDSSESLYCAVRGVVVLVWAVDVVGASVVVGASFVVAASDVGPYAVVACVEEHVVGAYVEGASVEGAYVGVASAVAESVVEEVLEASLVDLGGSEASPAGKTYLDQLELASSFVEVPSEVLFGPWACPDALHQEILDSYAVGVR